MLRRNKVRLFFFLKNFLRGLLFFGIAIIFYKVTFSYLDLSSLKDQITFDFPTTFVFVLFFSSEVILGVIPPELFMIWAITSKPLSSYFFYVLSFSIISYIAGIDDFKFGKERSGDFDFLSNWGSNNQIKVCLLYTSDAADE